MEGDDRDDFLQKLTSKYPALQYFDISEEFSPQELTDLRPELHLNMNQMSPHSKKTMKRIRQFANQAESKFKNARQLYRLLHNNLELVTEIIMSNFFLM